MSQALKTYTKGAPFYHVWNRRIGTCPVTAAFIVQVELVLQSQLPQSAGAGHD